MWESECTSPVGGADPLVLDMAYIEYCVRIVCREQRAASTCRLHQTITGWTNRQYNVAEDRPPRASKTTKWRTIKLCLRCMFGVSSQQSAHAEANSLVANLTTRFIAQKIQILNARCAMDQCLQAWRCFICFYFRYIFCVRMPICVCLRFITSNMFSYCRATRDSCAPHHALGSRDRQQRQKEKQPNIDFRLFTI